MRVWWLCGLWVLTSLIAEPSRVSVENLTILRQRRMLEAYDELKPEKQVRVAVIARGFDQLSANEQKELLYFPNHAFFLGENRESAGDGTLIAALTGYSPERATFILVPVKAEEDLIAALDPLALAGVDVVANAVVFPDRGESTPALRAAIQSFLKKTKATWFQAAGEEALRTVVMVASDTNEKGEVNFAPPYKVPAGAQQLLTSRVINLKGTLTLSWHPSPDRKRESLAGAAFQLCLARRLSNEAGSEEAVACAEPQGDRTSLRVKLGSNEGRPYVVTVKPVGAVDPKGIRFRLHFQPENSQTVIDETPQSHFAWVKPMTHYNLCSPADLDEVITVQAVDSVKSFGPTFDEGAKPEVMMGSEPFRFDDGRALGGVALAVAEAAASFTMAHGWEPQFSGKEDVLAFRALWPTPLLQQLGWSLEPTELKALVKAHPGVVRYLNARIKDRWLGVRGAADGKFEVLTTADPTTLANFKLPANQPPLFYLSAPNDPTGHNIQAVAIADVTGPNDKIITPEGFQPETRVRLSHKDVARGLADEPLFWLLPTPEDLVAYTVAKRLGEKKVPAFYLQEAFPFPNDLLPAEGPAVVPPRPAVQPLPAPKVAATPGQTKKVWLANYTDDPQITITAKWVDGNGQSRSTTLTMGDRRKTGVTSWVKELGEAQVGSQISFFRNGEEYFTDVDNRSVYWISR